MDWCQRNVINKSVRSSSAHSLQPIVGYAYCKDTGPSDVLYKLIDLYSCNGFAELDI